MVNNRFKRAVDYRTYCLVNPSMKYDRLVLNYIAKMAKQMTAQMQSLNYNPFGTISTIKFLKIYKLACDTNGIHESAAM